VAIEIVIKLDWADDVRVYDGAREAVILLVAVGTRNGEEDHFVVLADDDESDGWVEVKFGACVCGVGGGAIVRSTNAREKRDTQGTHLGWSGAPCR